LQLSIYINLIIKQLKSHYYTVVFHKISHRKVINKRRDIVFYYAALITMLK